MDQQNVPSLERQNEDGLYEEELQKLVDGIAEDVKAGKLKPEAVKERIGEAVEASAYSRQIPLLAVVVRHLHEAHIPFLREVIGPFICGIVYERLIAQKLVEPPPQERVIELGKVLPPAGIKAIEAVLRRVKKKEFDIMDPQAVDGIKAALAPHKEHLATHGIDDSYLAYALIYGFSQKGG